MPRKDTFNNNNRLRLYAFKVELTKAAANAGVTRDVQGVWEVVVAGGLWERVAIVVEEESAIRQMRNQVSGQGVFTGATPARDADDRSRAIHQHTNKLCQKNSCS
jgi:hypothetical protein